LSSSRDRKLDNVVAPRQGFAQGKSMNADSPRQAYALLAAVIVLWGVNWPIMKFGLGYIGPLWFAAIRILTGSACLFALLAVQRRLALPRRSDLPVVVSVGGLQIGLAMALMHIGLQFVEAGRSAILFYTTPLWVTPMAIVVLGERLGPARLAGLALGLSGVAVLFGPGTFDFGDRDAMLGNGILLGAAVVWAAVIVHIRRHQWSMSPLALMPWQMLFGGALLTLVAGVLEGAADIRWSVPLFAVLVYNGPIASAFCFWAIVSVSRGLPAISSTLGSLGVPVVGVVSSAIALGEPPSVGNLAGLALIAAGVACVAVADLRQKSAS
jgi:drug/metabolite transporter (DMT)-like permease